MNIHFIGIGGISMSGLAAISLNQGHKVSGSDNATNNILADLQKKGAIIKKGHSIDNIDNKIDLVVYTAAIKKDNPELLQAKNLGIKTQERSEFLGHIMENYNKSYAIAGTHGKTSTTSMLSSILLEAKSDPTILVGGYLPIINGNVRVGNSENFVAEACEYVDSFLEFYPKTSIILNIEEDHLDYFTDIEQIKDSFYKFADNTKKEGTIIANGDNDNVYFALKSKRPIFFGFNERNQAQILELKQNQESSSYFILYENKKLGPFTINIPGIHNVYNSVAAIMASYKNNISQDVIQNGISKYNGVKRRFEYKGDFKGARIYDDYAHHPTEIKATLETASKLDKNRLIAIFQPHTFTRTKELLDEFSTSFNNADLTIITDIYPSRELDTGIVHSLDLVKKMDKTKTIYLSGFQDVENYLKNNLEENDLCFTIGAGNIDEIYNNLLLNSN
ncbi:MAG: UDP-N-acetylmuramate--L-alanine ligase [Filifactoraceae bacterium]